MKTFVLDMTGQAAGASSLASMVIHQMEAGISMAATKKLDQLKKEGCPRMKGETPIGGNLAAASILCSRELPKEAVG